ncbi:MAG: hypothetical protein NTX87_01675 [Planctomycetota bacterium]|nr:hypothetical protein [Planctomycetota bacterium]
MESLFPLVAGGAGACQCLFFALVAAGIVALIIYGIMKARERREAMARMAAQWGLQYYPDDPFDIPSRYAQFDLFDEGHSRSASNVMAGRIDGRDAILCDYQYTTGSGKNQSTHSFQAAILTLPILAARLHVRQESVFDKIASWVGHDDINFESAEFSRRYHVKCDNRKFAYDIFHARLIEYLLACGDMPALEMNGPTLLLYDSQSKLENFQRLLTIGQEIIRSIPEYVLHERGPGGQEGGRA